MQQQIYVYGNMTWQGSIKFINPFPSPRRGGMVELISVLSAEGDGKVEFRVSCMISIQACSCFLKMYCMALSLLCYAYVLTKPWEGSRPLPL